MFSVVKTGKKTKKKSWKRMITKPTFVGPGFTRRPVKYEVRTAIAQRTERILTVDPALHQTYGIALQEGERHAP